MSFPLIHSPVVPRRHVGVADAEAYCAWDGGRLPTAEEWEALARGPERRIFPWGNDWDDTAARWMGSNAIRRPASVAQFPAALNSYRTTVRVHSIIAESTQERP